MEADNERGAWLGLGVCAA